MVEELINIVKANRITEAQEDHLMSCESSDNSGDVWDAAFTRGCASIAKTIEGILAEYNISVPQ